MVRSLQNPPLVLLTLVSDAIGSISFHPIFPLGLTVSGSRQFDPPRDIRPIRPDASRGAMSTDTDDDSSSDSGSDDEEEVQEASHLGLPRPHDASMKLWDFASPEPPPKQG